MPFTCCNVFKVSEAMVCCLMPSQQDTVIALFSIYLDVL